MSIGERRDSTLLPTQPSVTRAVRTPEVRESSRRVHRHISHRMCPWNHQLSVELAEDSPVTPREFIAAKDAVTLATNMLALDAEQFSAACRTSPMKRAKLRGVAAECGCRAGECQLDGATPRATDRAKLPT